MTNPIPGADCERELLRDLLEAYRSATGSAYCQVPENEALTDRVDAVLARAAAKVGANVAADIPTWQVQMDDYEERFGKSAGRPAIYYAKEEIAALRARIAGEKTNGA